VINFFVVSRDMCVVVAAVCMKEKAMKLLVVAL
jgi:hypothetical protein